MHAAPRLPLTIVAALAALALPATATAKKPDGGKLPAKWQKRFHVRSAAADPDRDGLTNLTEFRAHTNPRRADSDRDGVGDAAEDGDRDGLDNATEQRAGTNPRRRDSDHDRLPDGREDADRDGLANAAEQATANDPGNRDSDGDGIRDGQENAGQVVGFHGGVLRLRLAVDGKVVEGAVDPANVGCSTTDDLEAGYDDEVLAVDDPAPDDATEDPAADEDPVDPVDDGPVAQSAAVADDAPADDATGDPCVDEVLAPGAWVHEAEVSTGDDGGLSFDTVVLVGDAGVAQAQ